MQHVAKISCRNGIEIEYREKKGYNRREKCNMLQKSLLKTELIKKEFTEDEKCKIIAKISCRNSADRKKCACQREQDSILPRKTLQLWRSFCYTVSFGKCRCVLALRAAGTVLFAADSSGG